MLSLCRTVYCLVGRMLYWLHPKAFIWRHARKRNPNKPIITRLSNGAKVRIYPHDVIGKDIYLHGWFEAAECQFISESLQEGMFFFDIGANLG